MTAGIGGGSARNNGENGLVGIGGGSNGSGGNAGANTGSGGGGSGQGSYQDYLGIGGAGGSGVVVFRMPTESYSGVTTGNPTVTTDGSDTILTYTGSGTYTG